uniref:Uncharacterized protein n=1 Tax=Meloidogyne incognita TaxID=6306 RepID=A0A914KHE4_MELIC
MVGNGTGVLYMDNGADGCWWCGCEMLVVVLLLLVVFCCCSWWSSAQMLHNLYAVGGSAAVGGLLCLPLRAAAFGWDGGVLQLRNAIPLPQPYFLRFICSFLCTDFSNLLYLTFKADMFGQHGIAVNQLLEKWNKLGCFKKHFRYSPMLVGYVTL